MKRAPFLALSCVVLAGFACGRAGPSVEAASSGPAHADVGPAPLAPEGDGSADAAPEAGTAQMDPDGNDDRGEPGAGVIPKRAHFEKVGRTWASLTRICDLVPLGDALYAAHAVAPLGIDGATITKYRKSELADGGTGQSLTIAFDWNRPGEPSKGGGAGQGFARIRSIDGRLWVPDSDPPYDGFGILDHGTEGYVFVSDRAGNFAKATGEHHHPPGFPGPDAGGAAVVPRAYHDLDVIRFRGKVIASTGSVPPNERAWSGPAPGALNVLSDDGKRFVYRAGYPERADGDVWRLTFMVRYRDALYAGIQEYYPREANDFVVLSPPAGATEWDARDLHAVRVSELGGAETLRFYADRGSLYWVAIDKDGQGKLRVTRDGVEWHEIRLPDGAGRPADVTRFRDGLVVLAEHGLFALSPTEQLTEVASWTDAKTFAVDDLFCAPPLAVYRDDLYAGSQKDGSLMRLTSDD